MTLAERLKKVMKGEVYDDAHTLALASRDASLFEVKPQVVAAPRDSADVQALVKFVTEHKSEHLSLTPRSGATDMSGGPLNESIIVDVAKHLNRLKEIGQDSAVTEPGLFYRDFEKETLKHGLLLPSYPASREICTVGGMAANNAGGEKTLTYGQTKEYVQALKVVLADGKEYDVKPLSADELQVKMGQQDFEGQVYRETHKLIEDNYDFIREHKPHVSKNSAGYFLWDVWDRETFDLTRIFSGSQGTLGIITEIRFKLIKPKQHSKLLVIFLKDLEPLADVVAGVMPFKPESFESYDDKTLKLALRFLPAFLKLLGGNLISLAWRFLPEFFMVLRGGIPKLILLAEFTGDTVQEVDEKAYAAQRAVRPLGVDMRVTRTEAEAQKYWTIRRESFNLLRHHIKGKRTAPFIDDMVVRPEHLSKFLPRLEKMLEPYHLLYSVAGHVGDGNFHIIPLIDSNSSTIQKIIPELSRKVYDLILEFHGSITGEHNDGLIRSPFLAQMYGDKM